MMRKLSLLDFYLNAIKFIHVNYFISMKVPVTQKLSLVDFHFNAIKFVYVDYYFINSRK